MGAAMRQVPWASSCGILGAMAKGDATMVDAGGRELRVSSPDRVIFPATERTPEVTKLDVVEYYLAVGDGIMRALARPADDARALAEGRAPRASCSRRARQRRRRRVLPEARPARRARLRRDRADRSSPPGRHADEVCPTELAVVAWAAQMGTITFHPWPVRGDDVDHPDELRIDLDPQPGTDFADAVRVAGDGARAARRARLRRASRRPPAAAASTSTCASSRAGRSPTCATRRSRSAASSSGGCPGEVTTKWWKEERGEQIFVDYNQNARDRTIASAYSDPRRSRGAPVSAPLTWDELPDVAPDDFTVATMPARFAEVGDRHAGDRRRRPLARSRCSSWPSATSATRARATCPTRPTTRRCRASRSGSSRRAIRTASRRASRASLLCASALAS